MSDIQAWLIVSLLGVVAVKLDPHEALEIILVSQILLGYDRYRKHKSRA